MYSREAAARVLEYLGAAVFLLLMALIPFSRSPAAPQPLPPGQCSGQLVRSYNEPPKGPTIAKALLYVGAPGVCVRLDKEATAGSFRGVRTAMSLTVCTESGECSVDAGSFGLYAGVLCNCA